MEIITNRKIDTIIEILERISKQLESIGFVVDKK